MRMVDTLNKKLNVVIEKLDALTENGGQEVMYEALEMYGEPNVSENDFLPRKRMKCSL